jgi:hypothetical protein
MFLRILDYLRAPLRRLLYLRNEEKMILYIEIAFGIVSYFAVIFGGFALLVNESEPLPKLLGVALLFASLVFTIWGIDTISKNSPPCLEYETRLIYNAATKTMLPAQFCVKEGVWKSDSPK